MKGFSYGYLKAFEINKDKLLLINANQLNDISFMINLILDSFCRKDLVKTFSPIQTPILNRFGNVVYTDVGCIVEIGNGAGDFKDAVVGPGR